MVLLPREGFDSPQHYGAAGSDQGRDIVGRRGGELWYIQCKQVKECGPKVLLDEVEKVWIVRLPAAGEVPAWMGG